MKKIIKRRIYRNIFNALSILHINSFKVETLKFYNNQIRGSYCVDSWRTIFHVMNLGNSISCWEIKFFCRQILTKMKFYGLRQPKHT